MSQANILDYKRIVFLYGSLGGVLKKVLTTSINAL